MRALGSSTVSEDDVLVALNRPGRTWTIEYYILDVSENFIGVLGQGDFEGSYVADMPQISMNIDSPIKGELNMTVVDDGSISWNHVRIQPRFILNLENGQSMTWNLGIFIPFFPGSTYNPNERTSNIRAVDKGLYLQAGFSTAGNLEIGTYGDTGNGIRAGVSKRDAIYRLLDACGIPSDDVTFETDSDVTIPSDKVWDLGTVTYNNAINEILSDLRCYSPYFDGDGKCVIKKIPASLDTATTSWTFRSGDYSWLGTEIQEEILSDRVANVIIIKCQDPDREAFAVRYENTDPNNPISIPNLGYRRTKVIQANTTSSTDTALARAKQEAEEAASAYFKRNITVVANPLFEAFEIVKLEAGDIDERYYVRNHTMILSPQGSMTMTLSRVNPIEEEVFV